MFTNAFHLPYNALIAEVDSGGRREVGFEEVWNIIPSPVRRA